MKEGLNFLRRPAPWRPPPPRRAPPPPPPPRRAPPPPPPRQQPPRRSPSPVRLQSNIIQVKCAAGLQGHFPLVCFSSLSVNCPRRRRTTTIRILILHLSRQPSPNRTRTTTNIPTERFQRMRCVCIDRTLYMQATAFSQLMLPNKKKELFHNIVVKLLKPGRGAQARGRGRARRGRPSQENEGCGAGSRRSGAWG